MKRSVFAASSAVVVTFALAIPACTTIGDGSGKPITGTGLCSTAKEHCINVYVISGQIVVDVPELYVPGPRNDSHRIYWQIDPGTGAGYTFPPPTSLIQGIAQLPGSEFPDCHPIGGSGATVFTCKDNNSTQGPYKYTINLLGQPTVPPLDPTIKNG
jgi:hypothetical protein